MAGLVPAIHDFTNAKRKTWMPATSAGMTIWEGVAYLKNSSWWRKNLNRTAVDLIRGPGDPEGGFLDAPGGHRSMAVARAQPDSPGLNPSPLGWRTGKKEWDK